MNDDYKLEPLENPDFPRIILCSKEVMERLESGEIKTKEDLDLLLSIFFSVSMTSIYGQEISNQIVNLLNKNTKNTVGKDLA